MKLLLLFFKFRYATLQTWTAFFYILVMAMVSNISTLNSLGSLLSGKASQFVSGFSIVSLIATPQ